MSENKNRCGNCRWYRHDKGVWGRCMWKLKHTVGASRTQDSWGTICPHHEPKPEPK